LRKFTLALLVAALALLGTAYVVSGPRVPFPSFGLETTLLLAISTWVIVKRLVKIQSPATFTQAYLGSLVVQLLVWVGYAGTVFYLDRSGANANAVHFLINCLIFILLEVIYLYNRTKQ
jgi:hypothetical protein